MLFHNWVWFHDINGLVVMVDRYCDWNVNGHWDWVVNRHWMWLGVDNDWWLFEFNGQWQWQGERNWQDSLLGFEVFEEKTCTKYSFESQESLALCFSNFDEEGGSQKGGHDQTH